jgi:hypothetical protein
MGLPEMEGTRAFCGTPIRVAKMSGTLLGKAQTLACTDFCGVFSDAAVGPKAGLLRHFQGCPEEQRRQSERFVSLTNCDRLTSNTEVGDIAH